MNLIVVLILVLLLLGGGAALPVWPHSASWGYGPSGLISLLLIVLIVLALFGRI
jgi:hypothetical protein